MLKALNADTEFHQMEANVLEAGRVYERRNLTEEQRLYLLGKLYDARKHLKSVNGRTRPTVEDRGRDGISKIVAEEQGVGKTKVKYAYTFSKGIDIIRLVDPELADDILTAKTKTTFQSVQNVATARPEEKNAFISAIRNGKRITNDPIQKIKPQKVDIKGINAIVETMQSDGEADYTAENLIEQIGWNADSFIRMLSNLLMDHTDICNENSIAIVKTIDDKITERINQIKEILRNGKQL